jgi:enoyl-CoA hydratase/carnithine racemase
MASTDELLVLERRVGSVSVVSFNRPERHNALNDALSAQWSARVDDALHDPEVRCIVLGGEGRSFSSGRDTTQLGQRAAGESDLTFVRRAQESRLAMLEATKPIVAAVKGYVFGGAFEIALSADMRIAATDATFAFPEIKFGLVADTGGTQLLTPLIGPAKAKYLLLSGARIDAATAYAWGIVDWLVEPDALDEAALDLATSLAAAPPHAAALTKQLVDQAWASSIRNGIGQELLAQVALFAGDEHRQEKAAHLARLQQRRS